MQALGIVPSTSSVIVVAVDGDLGGITVPYKDEWKMSGPKREAWYAELRKRLIEKVQCNQPDVVVITSVEPMALRQGVSMSWFETAEVRGVLAEAAHAAGVAVDIRGLAAVTRALNPPKTKGSPPSRPASEFIDDDAFWTKIVNEQLPKKYRKAALFAVSSLNK